MRLGELAERLDCELDGDAGLLITGIAGLDEAVPGQLSFWTDPRQAEKLSTTRASAVLMGMQSSSPPRACDLPPLMWLRSRRPELAAALAIGLLRPAWRPQPGIHPSASIDPTAVLGEECYVGAFVSIGAGCRVGDHAVLHPHVVLYPDVEVGSRFTAHAHAVVRGGTRIGHGVTLQHGVVVGGDGFGFVRRDEGGYAKVPQVGHVEIGDETEIQANSCIDRATLSVTRIGAGVRIDNLVQVGHNCEIESAALLCAQVGLAGSTRVGRGAVLAGQVGVAGHCTVGDGAIITAQSGTHGDLEPGKMYSGSPAFDHGQWLRSTAAFAKLGEMQRELRQLRQMVAQLRTELKQRQECRSADPGVQ